MSWFKRRPRIKEAPKLAPHHISPITQQMMDKSKELSPKVKKKKPEADK